MFEQLGACVNMLVTVLLIIQFSSVFIDPTELLAVVINNKGIRQHFTSQPLTPCSLSSRGG